MRGLAVSASGLTVALERTELPQDHSAEIAFRIVGSDGQPVAVESYLGAGGHLVNAAAI